MLQFVKTFTLKLGLVYLMSYSGCVLLGSAEQLLWCILLITISAFIAELLTDCVVAIVKNSVCGLFLSDDSKIQILAVTLTICVMCFIIVPMIIISKTSGIQVLYDNGFVKLFVVCILWIVGSIPKPHTKSVEPSQKNR